MKLGRTQLKAGGDWAVAGLQHERLARAIALTVTMRGEFDSGTARSRLPSQAAVAVPMRGAGMRRHDGGENGQLKLGQTQLKAGGDWVVEGLQH